MAEPNRKVIDNQIIWAKKRLDAIIPTREKGNVGYDIYACFDGDCMKVLPHTTVLIPTGIGAATSNDYFLQVEERGSTGSKGIKKSAGVIDPSYRGEIFIAITNTNTRTLYISKNVKEFKEDCHYIWYPYSKAIAQLVPHWNPEMEESEMSWEDFQKLESSYNRGEGALGSSGK